MARFAGNVGFAVSVETRPGYFEDLIVEHDYLGDVTRSSRQVSSVNQINDNIIIEDTIEIVADEFASENMLAIRYVEWAGARWTVPNVSSQHPRLLLRLGGVYNGPTPDLSN